MGMGISVGEKGRAGDGYALLSGHPRARAEKLPHADGYGLVRAAPRILTLGQAGAAASSFKNVNRPSGLTTRLELDFNFVLNEAGANNSTTKQAHHDAVSAGALVGALGGDAGSVWNPTRISTQLISNISGLAASPQTGTTAKRVLRQWQQGNPAGGTWTMWSQAFSAASLYLYWVLAYESGYQHNSISEKLMYLNDSNTNAPGYLFEMWEGNNGLLAIAPDPADNGSNTNCSSNQSPEGTISGDGTQNGYRAGWPSANTWLQYELLLQSAGSPGNGRVRWWRNGVLYADHVGRSFVTLTRAILDDTWGGTGNKTGTHAKLTDYFLVATN